MWHEILCIVLFFFTIILIICCFRFLSEVSWYSCTQLPCLRMWCFLCTILVSFQQTLSQSLCLIQESYCVNISMTCFLIIIWKVVPWHFSKKFFLKGSFFFFLFISTWNIVFFFFFKFIIKKIVLVFSLCQKYSSLFFFSF